MESDLRAQNAPMMKGTEVVAAGQGWKKQYGVRLQMDKYTK